VTKRVWIKVRMENLHLRWGLQNWCVIYTDGGNWIYAYGDRWLSGRVDLVRGGAKRLYIDGELFEEGERRWVLKSVEMG